MSGYYGLCWWKQWTTTPCGGRMDPCHFLPQRVIKREHQRANPRRPPAWFIPSELTGTDLQELLDDPRNWRPGCRDHHGPADNGFIDYEIPTSARAFASDLGLSHFLPPMQTIEQEEAA